MLNSVKRLSMIAILIATIILAMTFMSLGGISAVTLPWLTINVVALSIAIIIGIHGRVMIPLLIGRFVKVHLGNGYVQDHYVIFENPEHRDSSIRYAGFSVIKVIPTIPVTDLKENERLQLLGQIESLFLAMPYDTEFGILKVVDPRIKNLINRIDKEIMTLEHKAARAKNAARFERRIAELREEKLRIMQSKPVSAIIYFKVIAYGRTEEEVKKKLDLAIAQIDALKMALQANIMVLNMVDLIEFMRIQLTGYGAQITGM